MTNVQSKLWSDQDVHPKCTQPVQPRHTQTASTKNAKPSGKRSAAHQSAERIPNPRACRPRRRPSGGKHPRISSRWSQQCDTKSNAVYYNKSYYIQHQSVEIKAHVPSMSLCHSIVGAAGWLGNCYPDAQVAIRCRILSSGPRLAIQPQRPHKKRNCIKIWYNVKLCDVLQYYVRDILSILHIANYIELQYVSHWFNTDYYRLQHYVNPTA